MASIEIRERYLDDLPFVCMHCGERTGRTVRKTFSWHPGWVVVLIPWLIVYVILALVLTKRMIVRVPLCDNHRNHWINRALVVWLPAVALLVLSGIIFIASLDRPGQSPMGSYACIGCCVLAFLWAIFAIVVQLRSIRTTEITERSITLTCVSPRFVDAYDDVVEDLRAGRRPRWRDDDDDSRPRPRSGERDDDDEDRPGPPPLPRRKAADDDDEPPRRRPGPNDDDDRIQERRRR